MGQKNKGGAELKRMKAAAKANIRPVTDTFFGTGAHPNAGELADAQVADKGDPIQRQRNLAKYPNREENNSASKREDVVKNPK